MRPDVQLNTSTGYPAGTCNIMDVEVMTLERGISPQHVYSTLDEEHYVRLKQQA